MRLAYYAGASTAAAACCLFKAFHERPNFYSATVYLSESNACLLILTNLLLVLVCSIVYGLQRLLYGPLRPIEVEQLSDKAWYAVLDTLLAMPSFREDVGGWLLAMFTMLLAGKVWVWIGEGKVDVLEQQQVFTGRYTFLRLGTSLLISIAFDIAMLDYCLGTILAKPKPGMMVIFTFEFAVLLVQSTFTFTRFILTVAQMQIEALQMTRAIEERKDEIRAERAAARQNVTADGTQPTPASPANEEPIEVDENEVDVPGWEEKRRWLFGLELLTDLIKLIIYCAFFTVSITFNGLPMHIFRDVWLTFASFSKRIAGYYAYRKATSDMNTRYPDATTAEIRDDACIVCRESMVAWEPTPAAAGVPGQTGAAAQPVPDQPPQAAQAVAPSRRRDEGLRAKKLPCGHILHLRCLKAWLERQQVCPTCRKPVIAAPEGATGTQGQQAGAAGGANAAGQAGAQGEQPAQPRQGRPRIFNFGPVRIGFLNGPGDPLANLVRQMQNQPAAAPGQAPVQDGNQQGPNHLGLDVPYLPEGQRPSTSAEPSIQNQITQIEQRLMQEAQRLGIEQQQLYRLRAMQQDLAQLRVQHQNVGAAAGQPLAYPPFQPNHMPPAVTGVLHGQPGQQLPSGHADLPPGMTLPEGWTVIPLHRAGAPGVPPAQAQPADSQSGQPAQHSQPRTASQAQGPTDESGSPLFVPTVPSGTTTAAAPTQQEPPAPVAPAPLAESNQETHSSGESKTPWQSEGWSFVDPPNGDTPNGAAGEGSSQTAQQPANGQPPEAEAEQGKGKGKAVAVEEVPDPDA